MSEPLSVAGLLDAVRDARGHYTLDSSEMLRVVAHIDRLEAMRTHCLPVAADEARP